MQCAKRGTSEKGRDGTGRLLLVGFGHPFPFSQLLGGLSLCGTTNQAGNQATQLSQL